MKTILAALCVVSLAKSVALVKENEHFDELINDRRHFVYPPEEGAFRVYLQNKETANTESSVYEDYVRFYIYTPENPENGIQIRASQLQNISQLTGFDVNRPSLMIIHGWRGDLKSSVNILIKNAALGANNVNVIIVDWSDWGFFSTLSYIWALWSVLAVGNYIGNFLLRLDNELNYSMNKLTLVGHSLGAHIAGNAGARINGSVKTIIGLDPSGFLVNEQNTYEYLDQTDGQYVQVIHTDAFFGSSSNMGHTDYYPNGGNSQPGCISHHCSHSRAYELFAESLRNNNFVSKLCDSYTSFYNHLCDNNTASLMGGYPIQEAQHGQYFLNTNSQSPFGLG